MGKGEKRNTWTVTWRLQLDVLNTSGSINVVHCPKGGAKNCWRHNELEFHLAETTQKQCEVLGEEEVLGCQWTLNKRR